MAATPLAPPPETSPARRPRRRGLGVLRDTLSTYLPLLLMFLLALATWWLARNAPQPETLRPESAPQHETDYLMRGVLLRRFDPEGTLRVEVRGDSMRHFPDDDSIEVDNVHIHAWGRDDRETVATARRAHTTSKADGVRLEGGARVHSAAALADGQDVDFESELLHVLVDERRVHTPMAVKLRVGTNHVRAAGLEYSESPQVLQLQGPLHATLEASGPRLPAPTR